MTSVAKDRILIRHQSLNEITKIQILGCKYFLLYSLNYLDIIINFYSFICVLLFILITLIISFCIIIHPRICIFVILLRDWCWTRMRPARLVSYAFCTLLTITQYCHLGYLQVNQQFPRKITFRQDKKKN